MKLPVDASQVAWEPGWKMEWARSLLLPVASAIQEQFLLVFLQQKGGWLDCRQALLRPSGPGIVSPTSNLFFTLQVIKHPLALSS